MRQFSENKNIAGFDNPGKSLYTTIREVRTHLLPCAPPASPRAPPPPPPRSPQRLRTGLYTPQLVENSLDACESIHVLPDIEITLHELDKKQLDKLVGISTHERLDNSLYEKVQAEGKKQRGGGGGGGSSAADGGGADTGDSAGGRKSAGDTLYYKVTVRDNGCGMKHAAIPDMLGRVLAGSKYGVRQTRGKFGLGAKMALIWSKQSTGLPVEVRSATSAEKMLSMCVLDIDIRENRPRVKLHEQIENTGGVQGTEITFVVGGNWSKYRSYIVRYMRQMAVITPYARFKLSVHTAGDARTLAVEYARRSEEMPREPTTIKHHPASVHVELLGSLLAESKEKLLAKFLSKEFSCVSSALAAKLLAELRLPMDTAVSSIDHKATVQLAHLMRDVKFSDPPMDCLGPVGEYNLRLGIIKELRPDMVATFQDAGCTHEGHPLIVEAGVCLGGRDAKPGITVYRFANRIPLLFEGGADVATQVSKRRINWSTYKIRHSVDKIGVFVSLVSTKVPFKGTGKEYIGDDIPEVQSAVKRAIERCCIQLKSKILKQKALADDRERRKNMTKYIPDVSRALFGMMSAMTDEPSPAPANGSARRPRDVEHDELLEQVRSKRLKEDTLSAKARPAAPRTSPAPARAHMLWHAPAPARRACERAIVAPRTQDAR